MGKNYRYTKIEFKNIRGMKKIFFTLKILSTFFISFYLIFKILTKEL